MQISTIQNHLTNTSKRTTQKTSYPSIKSAYYNAADTSFKGADRAAKYGVAGLLGGGVLGVIVCGLTAGAAIPFLAAYYGTMAVTTAAGVAIGKKIDDIEDKKDSQNSNKPQTPDIE